MAKAPGLATAAIPLGLLMAGAGCEAADDPAAPGLTGTTWRAEIIMGRPVIDSSASALAFEADGRVHGRGGCNRYFGAGTIDGGRVSFGQLGATRMGCAPALMDQEARFFQALQTAERWSLDEHGLLLVYSSGADQPSRFAPSEK
jgi:heat shock protein HslJ